MQELTKAQEEYFKDTVIRNEDGTLMTVYHATDAAFDVFSNIQTYPGFWFSTDKEYANEHGDNVIEAYINITNVYDKEKDEFDNAYTINVIDAFLEKIGHSYFSENLIWSKEFRDFLIEEGFDGMMFPRRGSYTIIAFEPNQIKSVDNLYPTLNDNFRDNKEDYFKTASLDEKLAAAEEKAASQGKSNYQNKAKNDLVM